MAPQFNGVCDVCSLVDGDQSEKPVICCGMCSAHLCGKCAGHTPKHLARRGHAWLLRGYRGSAKRECK